MFEAVCREDVEDDRGELAGTSGLGEEDCIVRRYRQELSDIRWASDSF